MLESLNKNKYYRLIRRKINRYFPKQKKVSLESRRKAMKTIGGIVASPVLGGGGGVGEVAKKVVTAGGAAVAGVGGTVLQNVGGEFVRKAVAVLAPNIGSVFRTLEFLDFGDNGQKMLEALRDGVCGDIKDIYGEFDYLESVNIGNLPDGLKLKDLTEEVLTEAFGYGDFSERDVYTDALDRTKDFVNNLKTITGLNDDTPIEEVKKVFEKKVSNLVTDIFENGKYKKLSIEEQKSLLDHMQRTMFGNDEEVLENSIPPNLKEPPENLPV